MQKTQNAKMQCVDIVIVNVFCLCIFCKKGRKSRVLMGCFGQKVAFFSLLDIKEGYHLSGQPSFLRVFGLVFGVRNLLVLFSFIVHKASLQPTGNDVGALAFHAIVAAKLDEVVFK